MSDDHVAFEDHANADAEDNIQYDAPGEEGELVMVDGGVDEDGNGDGLIMVDGDGDGGSNEEEGYENHWGSSLETNENLPGEGEGEEEDEEIPFVDDLPLFADNNSKALHDETKQLEKRRDKFEKVGVARRQQRLPLNIASILAVVPAATRLF